MILDSLTLMSDKQDLAAGPGDVISTDVIDQLGDPGYTTSQDAPAGIKQDLGKGEPTPLLCQVNESFTSGGAGTLQAVLETSVDEAFTSPIELMAGKVFALADLTEGAFLLPQHVPYGSEQYLRVKYVIGTAAMTAGTVTAGIPAAIQSNDV